MNMFTTYPEDTPTNNSLLMLVACASSANFGLTTTPTMPFENAADAASDDLVQGLNIPTEALKDSFFNKIFNLFTNYMGKKKTNPFSATKESTESGQASHKDTAVKGWDWLFSKLTVSGYAIPGWLIALLSVLAARCFAKPIVLGGILFAIASIQCYCDADSTIAQATKYFYSDIPLGEHKIPGFVVALIATLVTLYFSGTILDSALVGVACWVMYSVYRKRDFKQIVKDVQGSFKDDGKAKNVVKVAKKYIVDNSTKAFESAKKTKTGRRMSEFATECATAAQETSAYKTAETAVRRVSDAAMNNPIVAKLVNNTRALFTIEEEESEEEESVSTTSSDDTEEDKETVQSDIYSTD